MSAWAYGFRVFMSFTWGFIAAWNMAEGVRWFWVAFCCVNAVCWALADWHFKAHRRAVR